MKRLLALAVCTIVVGSMGCSAAKTAVWPFQNALSSTNAGLPPADGTVVQTEYQTARGTDGVSVPSVLPGQ